MASKSQSQRAHAKRRALERHGVDLNRHQMRQIERLIQDGTSEFLWATSHRVKVHRVTFEGATYNVVYDNQRKRVVTFLTDEMVERSVSDG